MVGSPPPFAGLGLGCESCPLPLSAVINAPLTQIVVTFNQLLVADPALDFANWTATWNTQDWVPTAAAAVGSTVVLTGAIGGANPTDDLVHFAPPPDDVIGAAGLLAAAAFADLSLTGGP